MKMILAAAWGLCLLQCFIGWGMVVNRALRRTDPLPWGIAAAVGVALSVFLGGIGDWLMVISPGLIIGYVAAGMVSFLSMYVIRNSRERLSVQRAIREFANDPPLELFLGCLALILALRFGASIGVASFTYNPTYQGITFNPHDDLHSYLVLPERLLAIGHMGNDPFNARQMLASLGGTHLLNAMVLAVCPVENVNMLEQGVALMVTVGALWSLGRRLGMPSRFCGVMLLVPVMTPFKNLNITASWSGAALTLALCWVIVELPEEQTSFRRNGASCVLIALLAASLCSLKSTIIPPTVVLAISVFVLWFIQPGTSGRGRVMGYALFAAASVAALMSPWMLAMHRSHGTFLYPLLGRGVHSSTYHEVPPIVLTPVGRAITWMEAAVPLFLSVVLLLEGLFFRRLTRSVRIVVLAVNTAWWIGTLAVGYATGGESIDRYMFPLHIVGIVVNLIMWYCFLSSFAKSRWTWAMQLFPVACVLVLLVRLPLFVSCCFDEIPENISVAWEGKSYVTDAMRKQAALLQNTVPPHEKLLVRLRFPFVLDFRRNPVYVADWPGDVSPPPGMPVEEGAEPLAAYLLGQGIRYVAYSYKTQANFQWQKYGHLVGPNHTAWDRSVARGAFLFQNELELLGQNRRHVYDDGDVFVLDLATASDGHRN